MKYKILQFVNTLDIGGATDYALLLAESVSSSQYVPYFAAGPGDDWVDRAEQSAETVFRLDTFRATHRAYKTSLFGDVVAVLKLALFLRKEKVDILHTHGSKSRMLGGIAGFLARTPVRVQTAHGFSFHQFMPSWKRVLLQTIERIGGMFYHALILESKQDAQTALSLKLGGRGLIDNIYTGIKLETQVADKDRATVRTALNIPVDAPLVVSIGRISPQKDPSTLIKTAIAVLSECPEAHFIIIGGGELFETISDEAENYPHIHMLGSRSDFINLIYASDIFLLTSKWEGIPLSILFSQYAKLPIVTSKITGITEVVIDGENGYAVPVGDVSSYSKRVLELINDPDLRLRLGQNGQALIKERHTLDKMITSYEKLYHDCHLRNRGLISIQGNLPAGSAQG